MNAAITTVAFTLPRCTPPRCVTGRKNSCPIFGQRQVLAEGPRIRFQWKPLE